MHNRMMQKNTSQFNFYKPITYCIILYSSCFAYAQDNIQNLESHESIHSLETPLLPSWVTNGITIPQKQTTAIKSNAKKPTFWQKTKKHFFDKQVYRERMQKAQSYYNNSFSTLEHEGTYFVYTYSLPPHNIYGNNLLHELKFQLSLKVPIWRGAFWSKGTLFFAHTQTMWFQQFNKTYSNPIRDTNYQPSIFYSYPGDWKFLGGKLKEIRIGILHYSNGIGGNECKRIPNSAEQNPSCRSRSAGNRIMFEGIWEINNFGIHLRAWPYIPHRRDNPDLSDYMGYADAKLYYKYKKHLAEIHIAPIITNYTKYHGSIRLGYAFKINDFIAIYGQYFYGYGDSLYEYNIPTHRIGLGIRSASF